LSLVVILRMAVCALPSSDLKQHTAAKWLWSDVGLPRWRLTAH
jgi:hypothetical protein